MNLEIKWMIRRDIPAVLDIDRLSFPDPWTEQDVLDNLTQRTTIGMTCLYWDQVVGFMIYELAKPQLTLIRFAVHPKFRFGGTGKEMINRLKSKLSRTRRTRLLATVSEDNLGGQLFLRACGFKCVATSPSDYHFEFDINAASAPCLTDDFDWHRIADSAAKVFEK